MLVVAIGWPGLAVLIAAMVLAIGSDVLRERTTARRDAAGRRRWPAIVMVTTTVLCTGVGLVMTLLRFMTLA